ncbi:MAG: Rrf2 family transcriptional regulator, partial [Gammaproteobacteria bacterium]|nr:Rrf2 family transcriptional regulator [Gammaproteobacteria bacterium]
QEPWLSNATRESAALNVMFHVGAAFRKPDQSISFAEISEKTNIPTIALAPIVQALEETGLIRSTESEELVPGRETSRIRLADILDVMRSQGEVGSHRLPQWSPMVSLLGEQVDAAIATVVADRTLADLLDEAEADTPPA